MAMKSQRKSTFVIPLGFWNGWAILALNAPPPLSPRASMDTMLAMGPPGTDCVATGLPLASTLWTAAVVTFFEAWKFWMTPWLMNTSANTNVIGIMTPKQVRILSTQKLP